MWTARFPRRLQLPAVSSSLVRFTSSSNKQEARANLGVYRDPIRQVFISQSSDIFTNLALEDWLYRNHDFDHKALLLLWTNDPCVVIGRHQNPWVEANIPFLRDSYTKLARRNSGGGTVYHDLGNLNCTFFTRRSVYDRRRNLQVVCQAIRNAIGSSSCLVSINSRDDIVITNGEEKKISGTAAKLGRNTAYHHCTLLVDVNECILHDALHSDVAESVESRATQSLRVPVGNISQLCPNVSVASLQESLGWQFLKTDADGDPVDNDCLGHQRGFQLVRPEEVWFPGINVLREEFENKKWIFGKTPKFKVKKTFSLPDGLMMQGKPGKTALVDFELEVLSGKVETVCISMTSGEVAFEITDVANSIQGLEFGPDLALQVLDRIEEVPSSTSAGSLKQFVASCIYNMVSKFT